MSLECTRYTIIGRRNELWTTAKFCRTSIANDRSRRLLQSQSSASCREGIAALVRQLAVGICAEEAVREFSCGYVCSHKGTRLRVHCAREGPSW